VPLEEGEPRTAHHVLVAVESTTPPALFPGECRIRGRVIHVWRGSIAIGTSIELTRTTQRRGDDSGTPAGAEGWSYWETVRGAKYLDAYLDGFGGHYSLASDGAMFLSRMPPGAKPAADPVASAANLALGIAVVGICCVPVSLVAAIYALKSIGQARRSGRSIPGRALVALVLAITEIALWIVLASFAIGVRKRQAVAMQTLSKQLQGKRDAPRLDVQTACDLVREQTLSGPNAHLLGPHRLTCRGPLEQTALTASLEDVDAELFVDRVHLRACFGRSARWFVTGFTGGIACPSISWPPSKAKDDAGRAAEENSIRAAAAEQFARSEIDALAQKLRAIRETWRGEPRHEQPCPSLEIDSFVATDGNRWLEPATVDLAFLTRDATAAHDDWPFLTSSSIAVALDSTASPEERAEGIWKMNRDGGPYLVIYDADRRVLPEVTRKKGVLRDEYTFVGGSFEGWMAVVDTRNSKAVCEGRLSFANSPDVDYKRRGLSLEETRIREALLSNLEDQFKDRAIEKIRELTNGRLRLGYKLLE
jgi:hypothetical protein